jgi:hypothetical protein
MLSNSAVQLLLGHLGGKERLESIGAHDFVSDDTNLTFTLRPNPKHVRTVSIALQCAGRYRMDCYGGRPVGSFQAPLIASAGGIVADNLASVLGQLTGIEALHHHHY